MLKLENSFYTLLIDEENNKISSFSGKDKNLLSENQPSIFKVRFRDENGEEIYFCPDCAEVKSFEADENKISLCYGKAENGIKVILSAINDGSAFVKWQAAVQSDLQLEWIEYPRITVPDTFSDRGGNSKILWPYNEGALVSNIDARENNEEFVSREPEYPSRGAYAMYPGMVFAPFMAVTSDNGGLYFGAHDKESNTRNVDFFRTDDGIQLKLRIFPGVEGGNYTTEADTLLGVFDGDWYAAAEIYRNWYEENKPERLKKIKDSDNLPEWYFDSPIVLTYCVRGHFDTDIMTPNKLFPYIKGMEIVDQMAERFNSRIMVVLMHWEGTAPWAPPYVWPPYGGEAALKEYADALHEKGHILGVYCSGFGWTQNSNVDTYNMEKFFEENNLKEAMCVSPKGELPLSNICTAQRSGYDMCPAHPFCYETLVKEASSMVNAGIDYAQLLDQNHGGTPYMCYSKEHGHPPVPGKWESDAAIKIMQKIKKNVGENKMMFGCESSAAEVFIPELRFSDNRYEINFHFGMPVPLYAYIYHEYLHNFMGNQVGCEYSIDCRKSKEINVLYRLAYSFVAGDLMTLVISDEGKIQWAWGQFDFSDEYMPEQEDIMTLIGNLNVWRKGEAYKYLHDGKMLKPLDIECDETFDLYAKSGVHNLSSLVTARYEAQDGDTAQIIVNITNKPITCKVEGKEYTVPAFDAVLV